MATRRVCFSIPEEDVVRLHRLTEVLAQGNRSRFLRVAMTHLEALERAVRLRELQTCGVRQHTAAGVDDVGVESIVQRVLSK